MIAEVATAIMDKYKADDTLKAALSEGLFFQQAPQDTAMPYGVFYLMGITQEEIMGAATNNITAVEVQFNLFTDANDGGESIATMADALSDSYHWQDLTIDGWTDIKMQRTLIAPLGFIDEVWQTTLTFDLGMIKN